MQFTGLNPVILVQQMSCFETWSSQTKIIDMLPTCNQHFQLNQRRQYQNEDGDDGNCDMKEDDNERTNYG